MLFSDEKYGKGREGLLQILGSNDILEVGSVGAKWPSVASEVRRVHSRGVMIYPIHLGVLASKELSGTAFMDRNAGKCLGVNECSLKGILWGGSSIIGVEWPKLVYWRECQFRRMLRGLR